METKALVVSNLTINTDLPQSLLPDNVGTLGANFTLVQESLQGTEASYRAPRDPKNDYWPELPESCYNIIYGQIYNQGYFLISGVNKDYLFDGSTMSDITSDDKVEGSISLAKNDWTTCRQGFNVVINNEAFYPECWSGQFGEKLKGLPFSPGKSFKKKGIRCKAIRSHKNFLFALGLNELGVDYPYSYRWSHPADENGLPFSWDEQDLSTLASKESVGGDFGAIVDGLSLRDFFCIYTERAIHILEYTGDEFVFRRKLLTSSYGCLAKNCVVEANNMHYVMTPTDIIAHDGTSIKSLLTNNIALLYNTKSQDHFSNSFAVVNPDKSEVWFCFPEGNYEFASAAIVYNYNTQLFGFTRIASQMYGLGATSCMCFGKVLPSAYPWDTLDSYFSDWENWQLPLESAAVFKGIGYDGETPTYPLETSTDKWDNATYALDTDFFCIGPSFSNIEQQHSGRTLYGKMPSPIVTFFEKTNWAVEGQIGVKTLTRVYPNLTVKDTRLRKDGQEVTEVGVARLYVGAHDFNGSQIRWNDPIVFDPINDRKIDVRTTGELLAIRFEFKGYAKVQLYGYTVEYTMNGAR